MGFKSPGGFCVYSMPNGVFTCPAVYNLKQKISLDTISSTFVRTWIGQCIVFGQGRIAVLSPKSFPLNGSLGSRGRDGNRESPNRLVGYTRQRRVLRR